MTAAELIEAIKSAETKVELEALAIGFPELSIDKRKSLGTLKDEILDFLEGQAGTVDAKKDEEQLSLPIPENGYDVFMGVLETMGTPLATKPVQVDLGPQGDVVLVGNVSDQAADVLGTLSSTTEFAAGPQGAAMVQAINAGINLPDIDEEDEPVAAPAPKVVINRMLMNVKTGAKFVWTPMLAKLPHLEEI